MAVQVYKGGTEDGDIVQGHREGQQVHRAGEQTPWSWKEKILFWAWQETISLTRTIKGIRQFVLGKASSGHWGALSPKAQGLWMNEEGRVAPPYRCSCPVSSDSRVQGKG